VNMDVVRTPKPSSWTMLLSQVDYFIKYPEQLKTLVIDTVDWAETLCKNHIFAKKGITGMEDLGYGKTYTYLEEEFGRFLNKLSDLKDKGVNLVIIAHAEIQRFDLPEETGSYNRWGMKLEKKVAPLLKEWSDSIFFANYKTIVVKNDEKKNKAVGDKRVMYTTYSPSWDAKNRYGLPEELPFEYAAIAHCFATKATPPLLPDSCLAPASSLEKGTVKAEEPAPVAPPAPTQDQEIPFDDYSGVPKALADLMMANNVAVADIQRVVAYKGYFPVDTPIGNYPNDFINGVLVGAWPQVYAMIQAQKEDKPY